MCSACVYSVRCSSVCFLHVFSVKGLYDSAPLCLMGVGCEQVENDRILSGVHWPLMSLRGHPEGNQHAACPSEQGQRQSMHRAVASWVTALSTYGCTPHTSLLAFILDFFFFFKLTDKCMFYKTLQTSIFVSSTLVVQLHSSLSPVLVLVSLQDAFEVLAESFELNEIEGPCLAFRRAASVLKSLPWAVRSLGATQDLPCLGEHSKAVMKVKDPESECRVHSESS